MRFLKLPDTLFRPETALGYRYGFHRRHPRSASVRPDPNYRAEGVRSTPLPWSRAREFLVANELQLAALIFELRESLGSVPTNGIGTLPSSGRTGRELQNAEC